MQDNIKECNEMSKDVSNCQEMTDSAQKPKRKYTRYQLTEDKWKPYHTKMLYWRQKGYSAKQMADEIGIGEEMVYRVMGSDLFRDKYNKLESNIAEKYAEKVATKTIQEKAREVLENAAADAASKLVKALQDPKALTTTQLNVCKDILDRIGLKPVEKQEIKHERSFNPEELESAHVTLMQIKSLAETSNPYVLERGNLVDNTQGTIEGTSEDRQETEPA